MLRHFLISTSSLLILSNCGGSSTGGTSTAALLEEGAALQSANQARFDQERYTDFTTTTLPSTLTYNGVFGVGANGTNTFERAQFLGEISFTINTDTNAISGGVTNFIEPVDNVDVAGALNLSGTFDETADPNTGGTVDLDLDGTLTEADGTSGTFDLDMFANAFGANAAAMRGFGSGTVTISGNRSIADAYFIADQ